MKVSVLISQRPPSKEWNELYYLLEGRVTISDDNGVTILDEQNIQIIDLDECAKKWEKRDFSRKIPFLYEPDSYELNPMLEIKNIGSAWLISGIAPDGRKEFVASRSDIQEMLRELHLRVKEVLGS